MAENPPAFPVSTIDGFTQEGMSLRDWFAGQAVMGMMSAEAPDVIYQLEQVAGRAYRLADAMLKAREDNPHA